MRIAGQIEPRDFGRNQDPDTVTRKGEILAELAPNLRVSFSEDSLKIDSFGSDQNANGPNLSSLFFESSVAYITDVIYGLLVALTAPTFAVRLDAL